MARTASAPIRPLAPMTATLMSRVVPAVSALPVLLAASLTRPSVTIAAPRRPRRTAYGLLSHIALTPPVARRTLKSGRE